jgi:hypothetical protein
MSAPPKCQDVCFLPLDASLKLIQRIPKESKGKAGSERSDEGTGEIFVAGCIGNECERFPEHIIALDPFKLSPWL